MTTETYLNLILVTTNKAPLTLFTSNTTFNIVYYNVFSDYWGNSSYFDFQGSVKKHIEKFPYNEYNMLFVFENGTDKELRETAITILTQHPPLKNDTYMKKLENIALSFQIRINVIWSHDDIFVRCEKNDTQLNELRFLVKSTGGFFISEKYGPEKVDGSLIDVVISSHYNYQPIAINVKNNNDSLNITWRGGPQLERMYLVIEGQALPNISSCNLKHLGTTVFGDTAVYSYDSIARCELKLHDNVAVARVKSATVHVGPGNSTGLTIVSRKATFDFISKVIITATIQSKPNQYTIQRYIPYKCYQKSAKKVARLFKPRSSTAHTSVTVTTTTPDKNYLESEHNNSCAEPTATFALAYSNSLNPSTYRAFIKQSLTSPIEFFNNYGDILFDIKNLTYKSQTSYSDFTLSIYTRKLTSPESDTNPSNVLEALKKIATGTLKNSLISVALKKLPLETVTDVPSFVNNNNKVIFFIDKDGFTHEGSSGRKSNAINTIAALTNGHFIVSNQGNINNFSEILSYIYKFGPSQELLFASTFVYRRPSFTLGTIDLTNFKENITVSITVSIAMSRRLAINAMQSVDEAKRLRQQLAARFLILLRVSPLLFIVMQ
uniref:VWFA domain-containing protein n=1 Tax=Heterorhabditis bacteriophora TaxID=37862 RepID=A0A1I7X799_HETBA